MLLPLGIFRTISPSELIQHPSFFVLDLNHTPYEIIKEFKNTTQFPTGNISFYQVTITYQETVQLPTTQKIKIALNFVRTNILQTLKYRNISLLYANTYVPFFNILSLETENIQSISANNLKTQYLQNLNDALQRLNYIAPEQNKRIITCHINTMCSSQPSKTYSDLTSSNICTLNLQKTFSNIPDYDLSTIQNIVNNYCKHKALSSNDKQVLFDYIQSYTDYSPWFIKAPAYISPKDLTPSTPINKVYFDKLWIQLLIVLLQEA